jgi:ligand-binding SRPBCC domain-containing protein
MGWAAMSAVTIERLGLNSFRLTANQTLPLPRPRVFAFFEDPSNLPGVIPPWLDFRFDTPGESLTVTAGAEFDYTIRWLGVTLRWRSLITGYKPPHEFTDVQVEGPYAQWEHTHTFTEVTEGTRVDDAVLFALPAAALPFQGVIRRQLAEIFRYRGEKLAAWARDELQRAGQN